MTWLRRNRLRWFALVAVSPAIVTTIVLACGPFFETYETVGGSQPGHPERFDAGDLGVVRPRFTTQNLARAYRVISGQPPLRIAATELGRRGMMPQQEWEARRDATLGAAPPHVPGRAPRVNAFYAEIPNCLEDAFVTATATLRARIDRFGQASPEVADWTRAQHAVFTNCDTTPLLLPEAAPPGANALLVADRAYQTAAAYFYAGQYDESERRFHAIAADVSSPWRPYGLFLAARSLIRRATVPENTPPNWSETLAVAERVLHLVLQDPAAAPVHGSARRLIRFVTIRLRATEELRMLSQKLATSPDEISELDFEDYRWLMKGFRGAAVESDLADWVRAMYGTEAAFSRALGRWDDTRSTAWLVAVLWHMPAGHASAPAVLAAAAAVDRTSPAFPTVAFARVRLLISMGRLDEARQVLAALPEKIEPGFEAETVNLFAGQRLMVAESMEQFLRAAPRMPLSKEAAVAFDEDAAVALSVRFPVTRLATVALSGQLPDRLRTRVAIAAFTRAVVLRRDDVALRVAPALRKISPALDADLDRYVRAANPVDRHRAGVLLILRNPGMKLRVTGLDYSRSLDPEPARTFESFVEHWWCGAPADGQVPPGGRASSELVHLLYETHVIPYPAFIPDAERAAVEKERAALQQAGHAAAFLARAALAWAAESPADPDAAEALARIVQGWRRVCRDPSDARLSRQAFHTLHRQFPATTWATRTKYWYR